MACGMRTIANGSLLIFCIAFAVLGLPFHKWISVKKALCHTDAIAEITRYLGIGDYAQWSEAEKQSFLVRELNFVAH